MRSLALIQTALPLLMMIWLALGRPSSRADLALRLGSAWAVLLGVLLAGIWLELPLVMVAVLAVLLIAASLIGCGRVRAGRPSGIVLWAGRAGACAMLVLGGWLVIPAIAGRSPPDPAVGLVFPFREGRYHVANGGAAERVNGHFMTLQPRLARWRGESYAVDLIRVDAFGFRTRERRLLSSPVSPAAYLTYGTPVYSPCQGIVEEMEESRPDMPVPVRDRRHIEGNFVRLRCGPIVVFLGHFARGGVRVRPGQMVGRTTLLGIVGNSGNTDEPHLHVHAQRPGPPSAPLSGDPLFVTFNGRFLVRNMVVAAGRSGPLPIGPEARLRSAGARGRGKEGR